MMEINLDEREVVACLKSNGQEVAKIYSPSLENHMKIEDMMSKMSTQSAQEQEKTILDICKILEIPTEKLSAKTIMQLITKSLEVKKN